MNQRTWINAQDQGSLPVLKFTRTVFVVLWRNILSEKNYERKEDSVCVIMFFLKSVSTKKYIIYIT